jgi:hypothetical protein
MADLPTIELDTYVKETLLAIVRGISEAQNDEQLGGLIGRSHKGDIEGAEVTKDPLGNAISIVRFDLATTAQEKSGADGKAHVKVIGLFDVGGGGATEAAAGFVNRLSFSVPIAIPKPEAQKGDEEEARRQRSAAMGRQSAALAQANRPGGWR